MNLAEISPYLLSGVVAVVTALLTHSRAKSAHKSTVVIDQQDLINSTYEKVLAAVDSQLTRQTRVHEEERQGWSRKEKNLLAKIQKLEGEIHNLKVELSALLARETRVEERQINHAKDNERHEERRKASRPFDLPTDSDG